MFLVPFPCCFQYSSFVFSLCQFDQYFSWCFSLGLFCMGLFVPLGLIDYFFFHVGEIFKYNLLKKFIIPFVFLFLFWEPYSLNVGALDIVPEVSETILSTFHSFYFILLFRSHFHHFIFQLTDSFFCFRYSAIDSFHRIFDFSNCVVCLCIFILQFFQVF